MPPSPTAKPPADVLPSGSEKASPAFSGSDFHAAGALTAVLRKRIISGEYKLGQRIIERDLREEFPFSNGPIREALQQLVSEGLAEREHFKGVRVVNLNEQGIADLFMVRLALLEGAAEQAARRFDPASLPNVERLKQDLREVIKKAKRGEQGEWVSGRFSSWLLETADNRLLREIWVKNMQLTLVYVNSFTKSPRVKSLELNFEVIDAICAHDVQAARRAVRKMTRQTLTDIGVKVDIFDDS
ncbi:MAG: GntR family transcriptional regulator [Pseudomonadota bacterium]